jgi:hypothetical protein
MMPMQQDSGHACDLSILIVAYQSVDIIAACLASIPGACTRHACEILLVDNGDGSTADFVAGQYPHVTIVPSQGNIGFAAGNNLLAAQARGRYLLLLNPDVVLRSQAIDHLMDATAAHPSASAWGGVTLGRDDRPDLGNTVHIPSLHEMASRVLGRSSAARADPAQLDRDAEVEVLSGSFVLFARSAWDEAGGLDDRYFLYCEEVDLFHRLGQRGHRFRRVAAACAYHDIGHGAALSPTRMLYRAAGNMEFARRHWAGWEQGLAFFLLWLGAVQRVVIGAIVGRWAPRFKAVGASHRDIALRPHLWRHGYDPCQGLLAQLERAKARKEQR